MEQIFEFELGRVLVFTSINKKESNKPVTYERKNKLDQTKPKNDDYKNIGSRLSMIGVTLDLFITTDHNIELATI